MRVCVCHMLQFTLALINSICQVPGARGAPTGCRLAPRRPRRRAREFLPRRGGTLPAALTRTSGYARSLPTRRLTPQTLHLSFGSKAELLVAAYASWGLQILAARHGAPVGQVGNAIELLFDHYEADGEAVLRMLAQEERVPAIRQMTEWGRDYHREWTEKTFQPLLAGLQGASRQRRLTAMIVATDLLVWKLLRRDMKLDRRDAERIVVTMVESFE